MVPKGDLHGPYASFTMTWDWAGRDEILTSYWLPAGGSP